MQPKVLLAVGSWLGHARTLVRGVEDYILSHDPWVLVYEYPPTLSTETIDRFKNVDGIISELWPKGMPGRLRRAKVPAVGVGASREGKNLRGVVCVRPDNILAGRMAFEHLRSLGFLQMVFMVPPLRSHEDAREGFLNAAKVDRSGCNIIVKEITPLTIGKTNKQMNAFLSTLKLPAALFIPDTILTHQAMIACRELGITVPEEIAILGVDNDEMMCNLCSPPLTVIDRGTRQMGYQAAALLDRMLKGGHVPKKTFIVEPVGVVGRRSTDSTAITDPRVAAVVRFIREQACDGIKVSHVLKHAGLSRISLEYAVKKAIGRTIFSEITRVRIERAKYLLRETNMKLPNISEACGFSWATRLSAAFKKNTGYSPTEYRNKQRV